MYAIHVFSGKLQGALLNGMTNRNVAIKKAYANTIGHLIRVKFVVFKIVLFLECISGECPHLIKPVN